jgi:hypothetical protein
MYCDDDAGGQHYLKVGMPQFLELVSGIDAQYEVGL